MIVDIYPVLSDLERDLDNPFVQETSQWWGIGRDARNARINDTISHFDKHLHSSEIDDLMSYSEGLKRHLKNAITKHEGNWEGYEYEDVNEYKGVLRNCYTQLTFAFFSLILREYNRKNNAMDVSAFATSAGINNIDMFIPEICKAANDWGIFHTPSIAFLLNAPNIVGTKMSKPPRYRILKNDKALDGLNKLEGSRFCNPNKMWIKEGHTNYQRAMAAYMIGINAGIIGYYAAFEDLWNCKHLSSDKSKAEELKSTKARARVDEIKKLLER